MHQRRVVARKRASLRRVARHSPAGQAPYVTIQNLALQYNSLPVRTEKFQFLEKEQNRNFGYKIVISVKNPEFILYISDDETDFTVGIVSRNLAST